MTQQGTPSGPSVFGHEFAVGDNAPDLDWLQVDDSPEASQEDQSGGEQPTPAPVAPAGETQQTPPEQPQAPVPTPVQGEQQPPSEAEAQPPASETPSEETPATRKYANRYGTVEDLEKGYLGMANQKSRFESEAARLRREVAQYRAALEQVKPYLQQAQPQVPEFDPSDPQAVEQLVQQRVQAETQRLQQTTQAQELERTAAEFLAAHPELTQDEELDVAVGTVISNFQTAPDDTVRNELFPITRDNLELAYEIAKDPVVTEAFDKLDLVPTRESLAIAKEAAANPALYEVLVANPTAVDTDEGLAWARKMAALPGLHAAAAQTAQPPSPQQMQQAAFVETGGGGAPIEGAPGGSPADRDDEWEAVEASFKGRDDNIFGLPVSR